MKLRMSRIVAWIESIARSTAPCALGRVLGDDLGQVLERQRDAVQALDDRVVQVPADPLALVDDRQPLDLLVQPGVLDRDASVEGEHLDELAGRFAERRRASSLLVRYRLPIERPLLRIGVPRNECISGWFGGKADSDGRSVAMSSMRNELFSRMISPSRPWPRGSGPIRCRVSSESPLVMNCSILPKGPTIPSAAY